MFFPKLRRSTKPVFFLLALVFAASFVFLGVGSGSSGLSDLLQGNFSGLFGGNSANDSVNKARGRTQKHPQDAQAWRDLATALETAGKPTAAIAPLERYRTLRPKDTDALNELASLYLSKADTARNRATAVQQAAGASLATSTFEPDPSSKVGKALSGSSDPVTGADPVNRAVQTLVQQRATDAYTEATNAYKKAVAVYRSVTRVNATDPNAWFQLAQAAEAAQDTATAKLAYARFLKLAPDDPNAPAVRQRLKQLAQQQAAPTAQAAG